MYPGSVTETPEGEDAAITVQGPVGPARLEDFDYDWYIRVKFQIKDVKIIDKASAVTRMENDVVSLFEGA